MKLSNSGQEAVNSYKCLDPRINIKRNISRLKHEKISNNFKFKLVKIALKARLYSKMWLNMTTVVIVMICNI